MAANGDQMGGKHGQIYVYFITLNRVKHPSLTTVGLYISGQLRGFDGDTSSVENPDSDSSDENPEENPPNSSQEFREQGMQTDEEEWDQKIVDAILNALPLKHQQGDSIK